MMITGVIERLQYVVCIIFIGRDFHYKTWSQQLNYDQLN